MFVIDRLVPHLSNFLLFTWRLLAIFSCVICRGGNQTEPGPHSWALLRCFLPFCYLAFARPRAVHLELSLFSGFSDRCGEISTTAWWTPTTSQHRGGVTFDVTLNSFHTGFSSHLPNWTLLECDAGEGWYTSSNTKRSCVMPSRLERTAPRHTEDEEEVSTVSGSTLLADGLSLRKLWENEHDELQWHFGIGTKTCWTGPAHLDPQGVFHPTLKSGGKRSGVVVVDHIGITSVILTECSLRIKYWYQKYTNHVSK
mgnify:CR=1 FL=1